MELTRVTKGPTNGRNVLRAKFTQRSLRESRAKVVYYILHRADTSFSAGTNPHNHTVALPVKFILVAFLGLV